MSSEDGQCSRFTQEIIDATITEYFDSISKVDSANFPTTREVAVMVHDVLGKYISGETEQAKYAFNFFVQCAVENVQSDQEIKRIMTMLKQVNESYKELLSKHASLREEHLSLQQEHEALMEEYLQ